MSGQPKTHLWLRAEQRDNERRAGLTPEGATSLMAADIAVTVEHSPDRAIATEAYRAAGCTIAAQNSWPDAPDDAIIFGLKELPADGTPLHHRHILFGHAFKGQPAGQILLARFRAGGGTLYDLEYLVDKSGRRVAAFGYWAGYAGAAVALSCWIAQQRGEPVAPVRVRNSAADWRDDLAGQIGDKRPDVLVIGALGRVGSGATDLCQSLGLAVSRWDIAETASGGPFPQVLEHDIFLNCILARPGTPVFVPASTRTDLRRLRVIGDIACDPDSDFSPIRVYDRTTTWAVPALRVHDDPPLDVVAIDNLPSTLPIESTQDYAAQLLPSLLTLTEIDSGVWGRARQTFLDHRPD